MAEAHGTYRSYIKDGCRCDACTEANRVYIRRYRTAYRQQRPPLGARVSAAQAWRIIRRFQQEQYTKAQIARLLGLQHRQGRLKLRTERVTLRTYLRLKLIARRYLQESAAVSEDRNSWRK
jgi:hypothetical protein